MFGYGAEDPSFQCPSERGVGGKRCALAAMDLLVAFKEFGWLGDQKKKNI